MISITYNKFCLMVRAARMACGPLADPAASESYGLGRTCRNDIAVGMQPLDQEVPHPRLASGYRNARTARTVARRLVTTAKSRINRRVLRLGRLGRLFPVPILEVRASPRSSPCSFMPCTLTSHSHFLRKERMSRPSRPKLNNGGAFW
jgi:hypothetical protein